MRRLARIGLLCLVLVAFAGPAGAATWVEPSITEPTGSLVAGEGAWLELPWTVIRTIGPTVGGQELDFRSVERLSNGNTLITSRLPSGVFEIDPVGAVVWSYSQPADPLFAPFHASRLSSGETLIVDRVRKTVYTVNRTGSVTWRYGVPDDPRESGDDNDEAGTPDPGELIDPFRATRLANGNTLIADNKGCRVIEIRSSDYDPGTVNDGYTADSIVWQHGVANEPASTHGYAAPYLQMPKDAQRLRNGNTLITDDESHVVIEVTPSGQVVWRYGTPGQAGDGTGQLNGPVSAQRVDDGTTLITDNVNGRILRVADDGTIVWEFGAASLLGLDDGGLNEPRHAIVTPDGSILIADQGNDRVLELGHVASGLVTSGQLDCGLPGVRKRFTAITTGVETPPGTAYSVTYSLDGGSWQTLGSTALPADTFGTLIRYRITLSTSRYDTTPRLTDISIGYEPAPTQPSNDGDGDGSGGGGSSDTNRRPSTRQQVMRTGTMQGGNGYTTGEGLRMSGDPIGPLSMQQGWTMGSSGTSSILTGMQGGTGAPRPSAAGLALLGAAFALGMISVPAGEVARARLSRGPAS